MATEYANSPGDPSRQNLPPTRADFISTSTPIANVTSSDNSSSHSSINQDDLDIHDGKDSDLVNESNRSKIAEGSAHDIDNNSLLDALRMHNDSNYVALHNVITTTISGAIYQLKSELTSEFKQAHEKQRSELVFLKQNTSDQLSKTDLKLSSNIGEINTRINTLSDKVDQFESVLVKSNVQKVNDLLSDCNTKMEEMSTLQRSLSERIHNCERKNTELVEAVTFLGKQFDELKSKLDNNNADRQRIDTRCDINEIGQLRLTTRVEDLEIKSLSSDTRLRKLNLIFEGITESPNENPKGLIINIFNSSGGLANAADIDIAYRLGKASDEHPRPILVTFHTLGAKDNVLRNAAKIKQASNQPSLWINRDQPDLTRRQTANTRRCYNLMRQNNHRCSVQGTSITYNGRVYHYKDLNNLPAGSRLEDTRMIPCNNDSEICFQSELSYLSNFYRAPFFYKGRPFVSSEQAFQWMKAISANDTDKARRIISLEDPYAIKQIGSEVTVTEQWVLSEVDTLRTINYAKFSQNRLIGERLRTSSYTKFHECTRNLFWGTGLLLPLNTREIDTSKLIGENQFGLILLDIRAKLNHDAQRSARALEPGSPHLSPRKTPNTPPGVSPRKSPTTTSTPRSNAASQADL